MPTQTAGARLHEKGLIEDDGLHARNFLDCVKSRQPTNCPVEVGHRSTTTTLLGRIAQERKRFLTWDSQQERVTNDPAANQLLSYEYRPPWKLPELNA